MDPSRRTTVVIAEELTLVRAGLAALCESVGCEVTGQAGNGEDALKAIEEGLPDLAILDIGIERLFALEVVSQVRERLLETRCIILSVRKDRKTVLEALRSGAQGFLLKTDAPAQLSDCLEQVLSGAVYVSPNLDLHRLFSTGSPRSAEPLERLSAREFQVFSLLIEGVRAKEIAARLQLSPKTVDTYRASLMRKLEIHDVAGLVKFAIRKRIIPS
jgi:DNA-binding NarL/FixJ family response regulator